MAKSILKKAGLTLKCQTNDQDLILRQTNLLSIREIDYKQYYQQTHNYLRNPELISIIDSVYLGDYEDACNFEKLKAAQITNIINCDPTNCENLFPYNFTYNNIEMIDTNSFDLTKSIELILKYIKEILKNNGKVFIHCSKGISRAPAMTLAYIISEKQMNVQESLNFLKSKYKKADPNIGFIIQLNEFYESLQSIMRREI